MTLAAGISPALPLSDLRARAAVLRDFRAQAQLTPDQRDQIDGVLNGLASLMVNHEQVVVPPGSASVRPDSDYAVEF